MELPNFKKTYDYENNFYLSCDKSRIAKALAHYELFKKTANLAGAIVECGTFKGVSFARFAAFRELFSSPSAKKLIGFDVFGEYPETNFQKDKKLVKQFIKAAGSESLSEKQLMTVLRHKSCHRNVELVKGDICQTVPQYVKKHPELKISLLNLDTDIYEPAVVILKYLYPKIVKGGILILDDYNVFGGETKAVDDYFKGKKIKVQKFDFSNTPYFIIKE